MDRSLRQNPLVTLILKFLFQTLESFYDVSVYGSEDFNEPFTKNRNSYWGEKPKSKRIQPSSLLSKELQDHNIAQNEDEDGVEYDIHAGTDNHADHRNFCITLRPRKIIG